MNKEAMAQAISIVKKYTKRFMVHDHGRDMLYTPSYKPYEPLGIYIFQLNPEKAEEIVQAVTHPAVSVHKIVSHKKGKMDVAKKMKNRGIPNKDISDLTGLTEDEIDML